ncbi:MULTISPECIES: PLDc N-terminal domain-containing protein [Natrialba]|uniref:Cardiolipin synthase N-terminal domain-containing protein n=1 Tax=Natrialba swarupiae TaxID=2448032 RepID=A0A5D5AQS0_9EURY|nr:MULTISPECIES: PLDc N-terminal domain-containing protein [Natrialba]MWV40959.1 hypothetical protein [Natrialba sp. INN-245]TYT61401.1 hypothetical protein FYC77_13620 [Natrialba swarupiae]
MPSSIVLQSGGAGFVVLFGLVMVLVTLALIVWTFVDAQENSSHPAFLWALVVFFAPFLGVVLYVLIGRDRL